MCNNKWQDQADSNTKHSKPSEGVCAHIKSCMTMLFRVGSEPSLPDILISLQPFSNCLNLSHLIPTLWSSISKRPPTGATPVPWSPISKEAWRGRKVERRYQGSLRWRSREGHGSLGGWAMSMGPWRAEAGLSHRISVFQQVFQCLS